MLELKSITKKYKTKAGEVNALDGVSLTFPSTGLVFITGKSGCGKTTLLNVIGGLDAVDGGDIFIQDKSFSSFSAKEYDSYRNTFVGFVFQEYNLLAEYTVEYNIKIAMELQGRAVDEAEFEALLKEVEIEALRNRKPSELSGGQRQRVAIARALVKHPKIIMADEPTGALDSATGAQVFDTLKKLSRDKLIIVVSHDQEFAEKYADRIIRLVDGKVVEDITFTERELTGNVREQENAVIVREGAELSENDKDVLAKAVKERKKIEITEKLCFRDKRATGKVELEQTQLVALKNSKMKLRSSAYLGVKSLVVKPIRLIVTIIISALAFAVFGLFDTIANFSTQSILENSLLETQSTMVASTSYVLNEKENDRYSVKTSQATIDRLATKTGGTVKGIFDFNSNYSGNVQQTQPIREISNSTVVVGASYYTKSINGFIEFDGESEINANGSFKNFDYKIALGRYPKLVYENGKLEEASLYEVAISTYLADSILYFLDGNPLNEQEVRTYEQLLDKTISVGGKKYTIVGLINCGKIPQKYNEIQQSRPNNSDIRTLLDDYNAYIDASARKCLFVGKGFKEEYKKDAQLSNVFYAGSADFKLDIDSQKNSAEQMVDYVYNVADYDDNNLLLFSGSYKDDGKITLAKDEILIHLSNFKYMIRKDIDELEQEEYDEIDGLFNVLSDGIKEEKRVALSRIFEILGKEDHFRATIVQSFAQSEKTAEKEVKIVGVYFGVDSSRAVVEYHYQMMISPNLMKELRIYSEQGDYNKILFSEKSVQNGAEIIASYLMSKKGLAFTWYNNSILTMIEENETLVRQTADLFLYATIALAIFSVFMLFNYINTSITSKRQSVGVLRGLGAGGKDIFLAFLTESLIIALINGALANVFSVVGCELVNSYIRDTMNISIAFALFGARQVLLITGMSLLLSILSSALPIIKISKKKPVELIRQP